MYKLLQNSVTRLSDGASIPFAEGNRDYREYLDWVAAGNTPEPEFTAAKLLANAKEAKRTEVRTAYELDAGADVLVGTVTYQGGFDSAIKLDSAKRLAEAAGLTKVTFFDSTNSPQVLLLADAQLVILSVAAAFQTALARKQAAMVKIDKSTTSTIAKVNAISY